VQNAQNAPLEQTLRDRPDDLALWCSYGDWLLERGDARGELISLEQRHARARPADRDALEHQIAAVVAEHKKSWDAALPPGVTVLARRHGFATKVAVKWSDHAPVLIGQALREPFVTGLRIVPPPGPDNRREVDDWDENYARARMEGREVDFSRLSTVDAGALATLDLGRLSGLDLSYLRIGALGAQALAVSGFFRAQGSGATSLPAPAAAGRIEELDLRYSFVGDAGLAAIAASPVFSGVRRLHLQSNALSGAGVRSLHGFGRLEELDLRYNQIGAEGAQALAEAPFAGSLRRLLLYRSDVCDDGVSLLASAPRLPLALRSYWRSA